LISIGAVSTEIRALEFSLEEKLENRLSSLLTNELHSTKSSLINHINHQVLSICTDSLLFSDGGGLGSSSSRVPVSSSVSTSSGLGNVNFSQMLSINNQLLNSLGGGGSSSSQEEKGSSGGNDAGQAALSDEQMRMEFERRVMTGRK
jgi:hypothetical protein